MIRFSKSEIDQLAELLNFNLDNTNDSEDDESHAKTKMKLDPGFLGPPKERVTKPKEFFDESRPTKDIWDVGEVQEEKESETYCLGLEPEYEMFFRQSVTSEDIFLQMGNKGPGSASCECLIIKIKLPDTAGKEDIVLDVSKEDLECKTKTYKLQLHLPHRCDPRRSKAEWDDVQYELTVTLLLVREMDFLNF